MRADRLQRFNTPQGEKNACHAADQREQYTLSENLFEQAQPTGSQRHSNCDLAFARSRTRKQHRGEIRARNQQDEKDSTKQNEQRRTHPGDGQILQRQHVAAETVILHVIVRMLATHLRVDTFDFRLRLGQ